MSIAYIKQELIQNGHNAECVNACFGNYTDIQDITTAARKMMFKATDNKENDKALQFKNIAKALNERIATKKDLVEANTTVGARDQTIIDLNSQMFALSKQLEEMRLLLKTRDMSLQEQSLLIDQQKQTISSTESACQQLRISLEKKTLEAQANKEEAAEWKEKYMLVHE